MSRGHSKNKEIQKIIGMSSPDFVEGTEFYVKYKNCSYRDCEFLTQKQIKNMNKEKILKEFMKMRTPFLKVTFIPNLYKPYSAKYEFDQGYITPEKVIAKKTTNIGPKYFVKWVSLDYDECTWETDVPDQLIYEFNNLINNFTPNTQNYIRHNPSTFDPIDISFKFKNDHKIKDFQVNGVNWIYSNWVNCRNSILADEMGLGKTIQAICFLNILNSKYKIKGPHLIISPLSTISNWCYELEEWSDFRVLCYAGKKEAKKILKDFCFFKQNKDGSYDTNNLIFDILLTSKESLLTEPSFFKKFYFNCVIVDEAHILKNSKSKTYALFQEIQNDFILLMSGTPIQNNLFEFWSLLHFIDKKKFSTYSKFENEFPNLENPENIKKIQDLAKPYILCRKKSDTNITILPRKETIINVELTQIQHFYYKTIFENNRNNLLPNLNGIKYNSKSILTELRKVCNHPYLIANYSMEQMYIEQYCQTKNIKYVPNLPSDVSIEAMIYASGKTILLDKLLPKLFNDNHKILIFSQMTQMLNILEDYLFFKNYKYQRLDGEMSYKKRQIAIENFRNDPECFIFLLSTRAGGFGLNLTVADTIIIYDSDFNPQNDIQAQSRAHRIGQTKEVKVYRLITRRTCESEYFIRASKKLALSYALLESKVSSNSEDENELKELELILKKGAYYTYNDECDEAQKFCEEDIDQILENRSTDISLDFSKNSVSQFSKVEFDLSSKDDSNVNFNDPDFWIKILPEEGIINSQELKRDRALRHSMHRSYFDSDNDRNNSDTTDDSQNSDDDYHGIKTHNKKKKEKIDNKSDDDDEYMQIDNDESDDDDDEFKIISHQTLNTKSNNTSLDMHNKSKKHSEIISHKPEKTDNTSIASLQIKKNNNSSNSSSIENDKTNTSLNLQTPKSLSIISDVSPELDKKIRNGLLILKNFGLYSLRFIKKKEELEIASKLIIFAYSQLPEKSYRNKINKSDFLNHIKKANPDLLEYLKEPLPYPFNHSDYIKSVFNGSEAKFIAIIYFNDLAYTVAVFITNEKLPNNFTFASSMSLGPNWTVADDIIFYCSLIMIGVFNTKKFIFDPAFPYCNLPDKLRPSVSQLKARFFLITYETQLIIPPNYDVKNKFINDIHYVKFLNWRLFHKTTISRFVQCQILRALYFYGIPTIDPVKSLKTVSWANDIDTETFIIFISSLLAKCKLYQKDLNLGPFTVSSNMFELSWITRNALSSIAHNLIILQKVRQSYNGIIQMNIKFPPWDIAPQWWNNECDKKLLTITAYYGFLFFSQFAAEFTPINDKNLIIWKNFEMFQIRPFIVSNFGYIDLIKFLYPIEDRQRRLLKLLEASGH